MPLLWAASMLSPQPARLFATLSLSPLINMGFDVTSFRKPPASQSWAAAALRCSHSTQWLSHRCFRYSLPGRESSSAGAAFVSVVYCWRLAQCLEYTRCPINTLSPECVLDIGGGNANNAAFGTASMKGPHRTHWCWSVPVELLECHTG